MAVKGNSRLSCVYD